MIFLELVDRIHFTHSNCERVEVGVSVHVHIEVHGGVGGVISPHTLRQWYCSQYEHVTIFQKINYGFMKKKNVFARRFES